MNLVLIEQVRIGPEETDFHEGPGNEALGIGMKQERHGSLEVLAVQQMQFLDKPRHGLLENRGIQALAFPRPFAKGGDDWFGQILDAHVRHRHAIPMSPLPAQQKPVQGGSFEGLIRAAAALKILALVTDRIGVRLHGDFKVLPAHFLAQVHADHDAENIPHLVGNILHQFRGVRQTNHLPLVIPANMQRAAIRIGKAANPSQVFITP